MAQLGFPYFNYDEVYPNKVIMDAAIDSDNWSTRIGRYLTVNYYYGEDGSVGDNNYEDNLYIDNGAERDTDNKPIKNKDIVLENNWHGTIWQIIKTGSGLQLLPIGNTSVGESLVPNKMVVTTDKGRITTLSELQGNSTYTSTDENGVLEENFLDSGSYLRVVPNDEGEGKHLESIPLSSNSTYISTDEDGILKEEFLQPGSYLRVHENGNIISKPVSPNCILYTGNNGVPLLDKDGKQQYDSEGNLITYSPILEKKLSPNTLLYIGSETGTGSNPVIKEVNLREKTYGILCSGYNVGKNQIEIIPWSNSQSLLYTNREGALQGVKFNSEDGFSTLGIFGGVRYATHNDLNDMIYLEAQDEDGNNLEYKKIEHKKVYDGSGEEIFNSDNWQEGLMIESSPGSSTTQYWGFKYPYYEIDDYGHVTSVTEKEVRVSNIDIEETGVLISMDY